MLDVPIPRMDPRTAGTKAVRSGILPATQQLNPAEERLKAEKARYAQAKEQANKKLLDGFANAMRNVDMNRTIDAVSRLTLKDRLSKEREVFLKNHRALPNTEQMLNPVIDYLEAILVGRGPLFRAYKNLAEMYERSDEDKARNFAREAMDLSREWEAQRLEKHSLWDGFLSGTAEVMAISLRILERKEMEFDADVAFNGGTVKTPAVGHLEVPGISWSAETPDGGASVHWRFTGILWRGRLVGRFEARGTDAFGDPVVVDRGQIRLELKR